MLNGLQWVSDGETFMQVKGQTIGNKKLYKCPYYDHSQCPFRVCVVKTPQYSGVACTSVSYLFDIQYTYKTPHADHVQQDNGECGQYSQIPFDIVSTPSLTHSCVQGMTYLCPSRMLFPKTLLGKMPRSDKSSACWKTMDSPFWDYRKVENHEKCCCKDGTTLRVFEEC